MSSFADARLHVEAVAVEMSLSICVCCTDRIRPWPARAAEPCVAGLKPFALQPLFSGGTFDADYNKPEQHQPIQFDTPQGTDRAVLHAFITGKS